MSDHLNNLEGKRKYCKKQKQAVCDNFNCRCILGIWTLSLLSFWMFDSGSDALGYSIMYLWILLPVTTFVVSLIIGYK